MGSDPGVAAAAAVTAAAPALFRPFAITVSFDPLVISSAPALFTSTPLHPPSTAPAVAPPGVPLCFPHASASSAPFVVSPLRPFGAAPDDAFDPGYLDAVPLDPEAPVPAALSASFRSKIRHMLSYVIDLFPQAAGSPLVTPSPRALFEDFFGPVSLPSQPIHFNWFECVCMALTDADTRLASFLASGRSDFSFLPSRSLAYVVWGE